ncbi:Transposase DDE domain-containing protein [Streptomyces sp. DvalAA-14]|nr:transposase [Streptomyces sp. SID4948]SCE43479.1 Transposase DDE domain-containing protein [Streptomyces sp. DvalAA-14]
MATPELRDRPRPADKAYPSRAIRVGPRKRGIKATIPEHSDQVANHKRRGIRGGRPRALDEEQYKDRSVVERCSNPLKQFRAIPTRFDKLAVRYQSGLHLASVILWLRETTA